MTKYIALLAVLLGGFFTPAWGQAQNPDSTNAGVAVNRATVNSSVTIAAGNTFQQVLASNYGTSTQRQSLTIQNNNTNTDSCWVYLGTTANATKAASIILAVGQAYTRYWPFVPSDAIQVTCASTSDSVYVDNN
jgi:hypothetical protein